MAGSRSAVLGTMAAIEAIEGAEGAACASSWAARLVGVSVLRWSCCDGDDDGGDRRGWTAASVSGPESAIAVSVAL